jgi:hypothetical protein
LLVYLGERLLVYLEERKGITKSQTHQWRISIKRGTSLRKLEMWKKRRERWNIGKKIILAFQWRKDKIGKQRREKMESDQ